MPLSNITQIDGLKDVLRQLTRSCPRFWLAVSRRRYILPDYRSLDYFNQEYLDHMFAFFLWCYLGGDFGTKPDPVIRTMYMNQVMAMQEKRPIYFLERELAEALMRTELPLDLVPSELHWIRREFRVMLPRDLLVIEREEVRQSMMFLDIGHAAGNELISLDEGHEQELKLFARLDRLARGKALSACDVRPVLTESGIAISGQLTQPDYATPGIHYGIVRPFQDMRIGELIKVGDRFETSTPCDTTDDQLLEQMQHLALTILLFLSAVPLEYETRELGEIRKLRVVNERVIPSLLPAKFIGKQLYRPKRKISPSHDSTGRTIAGHWVKGYWRMQPYGPRSVERRRQWIEPYQTHGPVALDSVKGA